MQELEKILEEMRQIKDGNRKENLYAKYPPNGKDQEVLNAYSQGYEDGTDNFYNAVVYIIRKHMDDGWIPCEERLPECEEEVYILTERGTRTTAIYEDGTMSDDVSMWNWTDIDFDYDEESDTNFIPEGWWEYRHFNPDDVYNNAVDEKVIAWQPLPEPYRPEKGAKIC